MFKISRLGMEEMGFRRIRYRGIVLSLALMERLGEQVQEAQWC